MNIKEAAKLLEDKYMAMSGVYGVNIVDCTGCGGKFIEVYMNTRNRSLMSAIPSSFQGFRIEKVHQDAPVEAIGDVDLYAYPYYGFPYPAIGFTTYGGGYRRFPHGGGGRPHGGGGRRR